jgi:hypothetical protein
MSSRADWEQKVDFAAKRLANWDGRDFDKLPEHSRWFSKVQYRHRVGLVLGAGNLWDMMRDYREVRSSGNKPIQTPPTT